MKGLRFRSPFWAFSLISSGQALESGADGGQQPPELGGCH